ncbi:MAG: TonB family protein [Flammeovirgaceae bacterium]
MMQVRFLTLFFFVTSFISHSQEKEVFGRILDAENQKPIYGANVFVFESTQGTTTNAQGFFKFSIPADKRSLVVSHIGYQTSRLEIPSDNKLLLKLTKEFQPLNPLHILTFEVKDTPKVLADSTASKPNLNQVEKNAEYPGGWKYFYNDVAKVLSEDFVYKNLSDTAIYHLRFSVEVDGSTTFNSLLPESPICYNALLKNSTNFVWTSAIQNNRKVVQHFDLPITSFHEEKFIVVEEPATPVGGMASFYKYVGKNLRYPKLARRMGVEGKVFVQFIIEKDGSISNPIVFKGIGAGCDEEALRLIRESPKWNPGTQRGKPVRQRYTLPIIFKLG